LDPFPSAAYAEMTWEVERNLEEGEPVTAAPLKESDLSIDFDIPFEKLSAVIQPLRFTIANEKYQARSERITTGNSGQSDYPIQIRAPLHLHISSLGDYDGSVTLNIGVEPTADWCALKAQYPTVYFNGLAGPFIAKEVADEISSELSCNSLRAAFEKLWKAIVIPIGVGANTLYVNLTPTRFGASDVVVANNRLQFRAKLSGVLGIKLKPENPSKAQLPELSRLEQVKPTGAEIDSKLSGTLYPQFAPSKDGAAHDSIKQ
jgi:hypothetical protein